MTFTLSHVAEFCLLKGKICWLGTTHPTMPNVIIYLIIFRNVYIKFWTNHRKDSSDLESRVIFDQRRRNRGGTGAPCPPCPSKFLGWPLKVPLKCPWTPRESENVGSQQLTLKFFSNYTLNRYDPTYVRKCYPNNIE